MPRPWTVAAAIVCCWVLLLGPSTCRAFFRPLASECDLECPDDDEGEVCGNDGRTYSSACEVEQARCRGLPLQVEHQGRCPTDGRPRCASQRALLLSAGSVSGVFVPECREDGSYAEVQCHASTGYCWCVDGQGRPVRGSSVRNARPACNGGKGRRTNRRRSSRGRKNKKGCGPSDRASFNANLIEIFQSEYNRVDHDGQASDDPLRDTPERRVVQWKFDQLDVDGDSALRRQEVRDLRRMARRIVRPRGCARTFAKFCDLDQDRRISRDEWAACVGADDNEQRAGGRGGRTESRHEDPLMDDEPLPQSQPADPDAPSSSEDESWDRESHVPRLYQITSDNGHRQIITPEGSSHHNKEEADPQDCPSARQAALEIDRQAPGAGTYVPECAPGGHYARAQCHRSSPPYCWCVHPRTGRPVRGTTTRGATPDCDRRRTFKGCSLHKKQEFLDELIRSFSREMMENSSKGEGSPPSAERAARWKFAQTDANSNGVLEKREWRVFRTDLKKENGGRARRKLRKCWRNLPRFCDENGDQRITMDEWLACTVTVRDSKSVGLPRNPRKGKNPLTAILKSD